MNKNIKVRDFDPDGPGITSNNIFGLPFDINESKVVIIPVPWDVTASNKTGACEAPGNIKTQSYQIDLYDDYAPDKWQEGIAMEDIPEAILKKNYKYRAKVEKYIRYKNERNKPDKDVVKQEVLYEINTVYSDLINEIEAKALKYLKNGQKVVLLGGEHSTAAGLIRAISKKYDSFGILQLDAHADLRDTYEGFEHSHASVMFNMLKIPEIKKLVQVGIRDYCHGEKLVIDNNPERIKMFSSRDIYKKLYRGITWETICKEIVAELPENVYISYDVDFLDPADCPTTGTPVPGGFSFEQGLYLIETLTESGRKIIGFDLTETGPGELDGVVSCRLLYRLINYMLKSS